MAVVIPTDVWPLVTRYLSLGDVSNLFLASMTFCRPRSGSRSVVELLSPEQVITALEKALKTNNRSLVGKISGLVNFSTKRWGPERFIRLLQVAHQIRENSILIDEIVKQAEFSADFFNSDQITVALKIARLMSHHSLHQKLVGQRGFSTFDNIALVEIVLMAHKRGETERVKEIFQRDVGLIVYVAFMVDQDDPDINIATDLARFWLAKINTTSQQSSARGH